MQALPSPINKDAAKVRFSARKTMARKLFVFRRFVGLATVMVICLCAVNLAQAGDQTARIGVLAKRGTEKCMQQWSATAEYLSDAIEGYAFTIVPL
jgi:hypothetical protein